MASLQDQLLKAGLVNQKQAKQAEKEKKKQQKAARKQQPNTLNDSKDAAKQAREEKAARDRETNRQRDEQARQRAIQAQIVQLIKNNALDRKDAEVSYHFTDAKVRKLLVTELMQQQLSRGQLAVVKLKELSGHISYEVVSSQVADKIAQRDDAVVIVKNDLSQSRNDQDDPNGWYSDFEIPDDLMW